MKQIQEAIVECELCPRLVRYRQTVAREKRRSFQDWEYWGKPVPSFGKLDSRLLILGLAPAAHGANRTGRIFTGDRSGEFLYETLYRFAFCNQPSSRRRGDGLTLFDAYITAAIHCAPPGNKPTGEELDTCRHYLRWELQLLTKVRVVVVLGRIAWKTYLWARQGLHWPVPRPHPKFRHGASYRLDDRTTLIVSYHPSQQNTQTGRLTRKMFDQVFQTARNLLDADH
ncbi:uracil-DNA glycosylase [Acidobacteria bacterium AH-259-L09]|nr:uracil-DNA glycosylase [Acidobacteria bacterium AH-259-L09]